MIVTAHTNITVKSCCSNCPDTLLEIVSTSKRHRSTDFVDSLFTALGILKPHAYIADHQAKYSESSQICYCWISFYWELQPFNTRCLPVFPLEQRPGHSAEIDSLLSSKTKYKWRKFCNDSRWFKTRHCQLWSTIKIACIASSRKIT